MQPFVAINGLKGLIFGNGRPNWALNLGKIEPHGFCANDTSAKKNQFWYKNCMVPQYKLETNGVYCIIILKDFVYFNKRNTY